MEARRKIKADGSLGAKLCAGENNTCQSLASKQGLCVGHRNGTARTSNANLKVGDLVTLNGIRYKYNGIQKVQLCNHSDNGVLCEQARVKNGMCKTHSPEWKCQFTGAPCTKIRTQGVYCVQHIGNVENYTTTTKEIFLDEAIKAHAGFYTYQNVNWINVTEHIAITCPVHGDFLQRPCEHLRPRGCPKCKKSKGEHAIRNYLDTRKIPYTFQVRFDTCKTVKPLPFDMYIESLNLLIEYDGDQHFKSLPMWGGEEGLLKRQHYDTLKDQWCINNGKILLRISYKDLDHIEEILDAVAVHGYAEHGPVEPGAPGYILATKFYETLNRGYQTIEY